jgi:hypothetical protein
MSGAIRDLHNSHPGKFITDVDTPCNALFENSPYITKLDKNDPDVEIINTEYPLIHESNEGQYHFLHGYRKDLEKQLGVIIKAGKFKPDIHLSDQEKAWYSQVHEITGKDTKFWIVVSGGKYDFTAKWWNPHRMQEVVNRFPDITFVQVGQKGHNHPILKGDNIIDLIGKTDLRQLVRLMYHADGCICPVTFLMHLAAAVPTKPGKPLERPCIVLAGAREPTQWEAYPSHRYLSRVGMVTCGDRGGCWRSRCIPIGDGDEKDKNLCHQPVLTEGDIVIPRCQDMISVDDVCRELELYTQYDILWEDLPNKYIPKEETKSK